MKRQTTKNNLGLKSASLFQMGFFFRKKETTMVEKTMVGKKAVSLLQIIILILGTIAISYAVGSEMRTVSAADESGGTKKADASCGSSTGLFKIDIIDTKKIGGFDLTKVGCTLSQESCESGSVFDATGKYCESALNGATVCCAIAKENKNEPSATTPPTPEQNECQKNGLGPTENKCITDFVLAKCKEGKVTSESCPNGCLNGACKPAEEGTKSSSTNVPTWGQELLHTLLPFAGDTARKAFGGCKDEQKVKNPGCYKYGDKKWSPAGDGTKETGCKDSDAKYFEKESCFEAPGAGWASAVGGLAWAVATGVGLQIAKSMTKGHDGLFDALTWGSTTAGIVYGGVKGLGLGTAGGAIIGIPAGLLVFMMTYHEEKKITYSFTSNVWAPPLGGENCNLCNLMLPIPCSEYQCRSLGKGCELVNQGTTEELCVWKNRADVDAPIIRPWDEALPADKNYVYKESDAVSPPDTGVNIVYEPNSAEGGCVEPFTPISFGINVNEPASCKIDYQNPSSNSTEQESFDAMAFYFGGSNTLKYNHTQYMNLPSVTETREGELIIENGKEYNMFVRCQDANGNTNTLNFVFHICVDKGKDTTPPIIVGTDPGNNMPVAYNTSTLDVNVYTNEPGKCRWDRNDKVYAQMANEMTGGNTQSEFNAQMLTLHKATLTGIHDSQENTFYFRCSDDEDPANVNTQSYVYKVIGTKPLEIESLGPNETIKDSTTDVKVILTAKTIGGYEDGKAICSFKKASEPFSDYTQFFKTNDLTHEQEVFLNAGTYTYSYRCVDLAGNADEKTTTFKVETDTEPPMIVRVYQEDNALRIITDEEAKCVYDTANCNYLFDDGIEMTTDEKVKHSTGWDPDLTFYIKCKDVYTNQPNPTQCSVIVRPFEIFTQEELTPSG